MKTTRISYLDDPVGYERQMIERETYLNWLFLQINEHSPASGELHWIIEGMLPSEYLIILAGDPKSGKTSFATALALAVATGQNFGGARTAQGAVLWLAREENPTERRLLMDQFPTTNAMTPFYTCYQPLTVDSEDSLEALAHWVDRVEAKLIVVDPLHGATSGRSLHDGWAARKTLRALKDFCARKRVSVIVLHHSKSDYRDRRHRKVAESAQLAATASMNWVLSHHQPIGSPGRLVRIDSQGRGDFANRHMLFHSQAPLDYQLIDTEKTPEALPMSHREMTCCELVLQKLKAGPMTAAELMATETHTSGSVRNAIARLIRRGKVEVDKEGNTVRQYRLPADEKTKHTTCEVIHPVQKDVSL